MADQKSNDQSKQTQKTKDTSRPNKGQQSGQNPNQNASSTNIKSDKNKMQNDE
jgi:hypothetical protein